MHAQLLDGSGDYIECDDTAKNILRQLTDLSEDGLIRLSFESDYELGIFQTVFGGDISGFMDELREAVGADDTLVHRDDTVAGDEHFAIVTYLEAVEEPA